MSAIHTSVSAAEAEQILLEIRKAKTAHLRWRAYAMALSSGYAVEEGQLPMEHTECQFGCWYYGAGQRLQALEEFQAIETTHQQVHAIYKDIFQQLFDQSEPSFWKKLLGQKANDRTDQRRLVEKQLEKLSEQSRIMIDGLEKLAAAITSNRQ